MMYDVRNGAQNASNNLLKQTAFILAHSNLMKNSTAYESTIQHTLEQYIYLNFVTCQKRVINDPFDILRYQKIVLL